MNNNHHPLSLVELKLRSRFDPEEITKAGEYLLTHRYIDMCDNPAHDYRCVSVIKRPTHFRNTSAVCQKGCGNQEIIFMQYSPVVCPGAEVRQVELECNHSQTIAMSQENVLAVRQEKQWRKQRNSHGASH